MFLAQLLDIGYLDLQYINELLEIIVDHQFGYTVREALAGLPLSKINSNTLIETIFYRINEEVFHRIKQQLENDTIAVSNEAEKETLVSRCETRTDEFSPYINAVDSYFNNELDEVTVRGNTLSQIVDEVIPLLLNTCEANPQGKNG